MKDYTNEVSTIPPTDLEEFIAELWEELGWEATTTPATGDDGVDVVVRRHEPYEQKKLIQVKQRDDRLDRSSVQKYSYLHHKDDVDEVLLVGTSGFTDGATESAKEANVKLIGPDEIMELVDKADANSLVEKYVTDISDRDSHPPESTADESQEYSYETDEFEELSSSGQVYAELANSIPLSYMCSPKARLAIALQFFRGDTPIHVLLIGETGDETTKIINSVVGMHDNSAYVNCQTTTEDGLIGRYNSGGRTHAGVFTQHDGGIVALDDIDELSSPEICKEPLTQQQVTVTRAGFHHSYPARFSCLATTEPEYGKFDEYEGLLTQIGAYPVMDYFDCACILSEEVSGNIGLPNGYLDVDDGTGLSKEELLEYSVYANEKHPDPEMTTAAKERAEKILHRWDNYDEIIPVSNSTHSSFAAVAKASARMRLSSKIQEVDIYVASNVMPQSLADIEPESAEFDVAELDSDNTQEERIKSIKKIIRIASEKGNNNRAPISEIIDLARENGISEEKVKDELESLWRRGEVIEPHEDEFELV